MGHTVSQHVMTAFRRAKWGVVWHRRSSASSSRARIKARRLPPSSWPGRMFVRLVRVTGSSSHQASSWCLQLHGCSWHSALPPLLGHPEWFFIYHQWYHDRGATDCTSQHMPSIKRDPVMSRGQQRAGNVKTHKWPFVAKAFHIAVSGLR